MQLVITVLTAASSVAALATPIAYNVCNFRASCLAHSATCRVAFDVWQFGSFETPPGVYCEDFTMNRLDGTMTNLINGRCKLSPRTFNLTFCEQGATLRVTGPVSIATNLTGERLLPIGDWKMVEDNKAKVMTYFGSTGLELFVA